MAKNFSKYTIGVDIGGSKINAVLLKNGNIFHRIKKPTPTKSKKEFLDVLAVMVEHLITQVNRREFLGIGCGIAGTVNMEKGIIFSSKNIGILNGLNIKDLLKKKFNCEVKIDNDARSFIRAEYLWGAGKGYKNLIGITMGTGVGGGIIANSKIIVGANGSAGEVGHMVIDCGNDLEYSTVKLMRQLKFSSIARAYTMTKNKKAKEALRCFEENLGIGLANIINIFDPEAIIIGGGAAEAAKIFIPKAKKVADRFIVSPYAYKNVKILTGKLGDDAGAMGAAALLLESKI